jgi:hypothetical protein
MSTHARVLRHYHTLSLSHTFTWAEKCDTHTHSLWMCLNHQAGDIVNTVLSNSSLSKSIFESEHGKVHVKKPPPGVLIIDGVTMAKPVAISTVIVRDGG